MSDVRHASAPEAQPIIFELVENANDKAGKVNDFVLKPIFASEAFRKYNWLRNEVVKNQSGNLRGMVINARMRTLYDLTGKAGDTFALISVLMEIGKEMSRIQKVYNSDKDGYEKASRILCLGSAAILRSVTSVVPAAFHLLAMSAQGYLLAYSQLTGSATANAWSANIGQFDGQVTAIHHRQGDGENWYNVIRVTVQ